jgi:peptidoglycan/xylan/chitin deacetylase (PgdA/CDA1 family)
LLGIHLLKKDDYAPFQNDKAVYHDDIGDYSSNEPTMDGTASLSFYLSSLEKEGGGYQSRDVTDKEGAIVRMDPARKDIYLAFAADKEAEGGEYILQVLNENNIRASFFFTGNFLRNPDYDALIRKVINNGHYVGPHSDQHLLYCDWKKRDSLLVDRRNFENDLRNNHIELAKFGITHSSSKWFMPPYEWYNSTIVDWARAMGLSVVNFTPGIRTNADYTTPDMPNYLSSDDILHSLYQFEKENSHRLNGCIMLIHPGTDSVRKEKLYERLPEIIDRLKNMGYDFKRL